MSNGWFFHIEAYLVRSPNWAEPKEAKAARHSSKIPFLAIIQMESDSSEKRTKDVTGTWEACLTFVEFVVMAFSPFVLDQETNAGIH